MGGRITLSWALGRRGSMGRTGFGWLRIESSGKLLFDKLSDYKLLKEYPAPWSE
jgi:hypothetical protein